MESKFKLKARNGSPDSRGSSQPRTVCCLNLGNVDVIVYAYMRYFWNIIRGVVVKNNVKINMCVGVAL